MQGFESLIREVEREAIADPRMAVFDLEVGRDGDEIVLTGETTDSAALATLIDRLTAAYPDGAVRDAVLRLPDPGLGDATCALVRSAIAPVHAEPRIASTHVSQYVLGHRLDLLSRRGYWWRVRGEDGYIGWVHYGYLEIGDHQWAQEWERGEGGEPAISLGAELTDDEGRGLARLPWGARVIRDQPGWYRLPDGRRGIVGSGEMVDADRLRDRFPCRAESILRSARRWLGTPYLWGGTTPAGADCSGYVQSVYWMHGLALPRDSDQQVRVGVGVLEAGETELDFSLLRPADLLFFTEHDRIRVTHVAISMGGSEIIHSALSNGGIAINDLCGDMEIEARLRESFLRAHRILPD